MSVAVSVGVSVAVGAGVGVGVSVSVGVGVGVGEREPLTVTFAAVAHRELVGAEVARGGGSACRGGVSVRESSSLSQSLLHIQL